MIGVATKAAETSVGNGMSTKVASVWTVLSSATVRHGLASAIMGLMAAATGGCRPSSHYPGDVADVINYYREDNGLARIPRSAEMTTVAEAHVRDLEEHDPVTARCNLHSWSAEGSWSACCYTGDHAAATCMWSKPHELTSYDGLGYEIASAGAVDPNDALDLWRGSEPHNAVILNQGIWEGRAWNALGAAISAQYAVAWFGEEP